MKRIVKYLFILFMCSFLISIFKLILGTDINIAHQAINTLYYFTPAIAILIVEKSSIKEMLRKYKVNLKSIDTKLSLIYVLGTAFLFPALCILCIYVAGNVCRMQSFGQIVIPSGEYLLHDVSLFDNTTAWLAVLYFHNVCVALIAGLTYNMVFSLGGEIGWRGFLKEHLNTGYWKKNIITGVIWGTWFLPLILFNRMGEPIDYVEIMITYILFITSSFLLDAVFKNSRSLLVSAAVRGIIISFSWTYYVDGDPLFYSTNGIAGIISLTVLTVFFNSVFNKSFGTISH